MSETTTPTRARGSLSPVARAAIASVGFCALALAALATAAMGRNLGGWTLLPVVICATSLLIVSDVCDASIAAAGVRGRRIRRA